MDNVRDLIRNAAKIHVDIATRGDLGSSEGVEVLQPKEISNERDER